jgi:hypothetical protein
MAETMFKTAQELLDQRRKDTQDNLLTIKAIEGKQRERPLSGYAKFGGMLGKAAGESLKDYLGVKSEDDYLRDYESGIEQRRVLEQSLGQEGSLYSPEIASQIDRFIEESGSNLSPEIKRASDFTRAMKGLTGDDLNDPMKVAKVYNDFGYTKEAVDLLQNNRMTPYQAAQIKLSGQELEQYDRMTPYQAAQVKLGRQELEQYDRMTPYQAAQIKLDQQELALFDDIGTPNAGSTQPPIVTAKDLGLPESQSEQPEPSIMDNVSELYDNASGVVSQAVSSVDASGLYDSAVSAVDQAMTSLDDFFTRGGASTNAFNLNDYATSKGVELNTLNPLQKRELYMQGIEERKKAFSNRVREQSKSAVQNVLPTK